MTSKRKSQVSKTKLTKLGVKDEVVFASVRIVKERGGNESQCPFRFDTEEAQLWLKAFRGEVKQTDESGTNVADDSVSESA